MSELNTITRPKPVALIILDGWGIGPNSLANAIEQAKKNNFDTYCQKYFCTTLAASGEAVGLPYGEMGNSEVGHLNIGAGRIVYQDLPKINKAILDKTFFSNSVFLKSLEHVKKNNSNLHLVGLFSRGGVHSSLDHLEALLELAREQQVGQIYIHAILDGRDMPYNSGLNLMSEIIDKTSQMSGVKIATICGRFWAMDRDNHWERIAKAYQAMVNGQAEKIARDPLEAIKKSYEEKIYDEELNPTIMVDANNNPLTTIKTNDSVIFFNFRADRARQLSKAFVMPVFEKFDRGEYLKDLYFATLTNYDKDLPLEVAFPEETIKNSLAKVISLAGLKQLHIAETEKYAHVTYFLNGGVEEPFTGEDNVLIPSPRVESYAQMPAMSAQEIKSRLLKNIVDNIYDFYAINFANPDMVAHTGDLKASIAAIEEIDKILGEIIPAILAHDGVLVITADHGNAEKIINLQTGEIDKEHSLSPVPFLIIGSNFEIKELGAGKIDLNLLTPAGFLADVAPTILKIMNLEQPKEMTGRSLI